MLSTRIIPCLDIKNGRTVKGVNFEGLRDAGDPVELGRRYSQQGADELVFLDITATNERRKTLKALVQQISLEISIPFTVGGGIRSVDEISDLLNAGADKVSLNSSIVSNPELITQASERFGSQCIVAAIDAKRTGSSWNVYVKAGTEDTGMDAIEWARQVWNRGAGEILLTSMDRDGTKAGFDNELLAIISQTVPIPLVASGGAGTIQHCIDAVQLGKADAVLAASIFHFREIEIHDLKLAMQAAGIPVRLH
jgi:imidazole glycerol-phosphate synthase subunit HisF